MRWVVGASLRSRGLMIGLAGVMVFFGVRQLRQMPVDVLPEFGPPTVEIRTEALGLSAIEVEQLITAPMEQNLLNGVAFLEAIRSESVPGLSSIELIFERGTDLFRARQVVQERLTQAHGALPNVSKPPQMLQPLSSTSRVMMIGLSSKDLSLIDMSVLARWVIRPRLMGVPGVANVAIWGQRERQLQVQVDPERLAARGVSLDQVIETAGNALWVSPLSFLEASTPGTGGFIDTPNQRLGIQHRLPVRTPEDLAQVPLEGCAGGSGPSRHVDANCPTPPKQPPLRLGDVATVVEDHQPLIGDAILIGGPGLLLVVEKFPEANALEVTHGVERALAALAPGLSGIEADTSLFRPATYIETSARNLTRGLLAGLALLIFALGLLASTWRAALVVLGAVLGSMAAAGAVLSLRGATVNAMVVAGLVLALVVVVDDAVADGERIRRRLAEHRREGAGGPGAETVLDASLEVRGPLAYATAILLLALAPLFALPGSSGAFLAPLALSYATAVLASMAVALGLTPALGLLLWSRAPLERREPPLVRWARRGYDRALPALLKVPRRAYLGAGALVAIGLAVLPFLDRQQSLVPAFKDPDLLIRWEGAPGTSLTEMNRITARVGRELRALPGVRSVGAHVGRAVMSDQVVGINSGELWVGIEASGDHHATLSSIRKVVEGYPGLERAMLTYREERIDEVLPGAGDDLTVRIYGQDLGVLETKAEEVKRALSGIDGVVAPRAELIAQEPTVEIEVDLAAARRFGIKPGDVRRAAAVLLSGVEVGSLFEDQKVFEVVVWGAPNTRRSLTDIRELLIDTPTGGQVRLGDVAALRVTPNPNVIRHEAVSRSIDVGAGVRGRDLGAVVADVKDRLGGIEFPIEHHAELLGDHAERRAARRRLMGVALSAGLGVFLLLQAASASWRLAAAVFLALPPALAGGVLAAWIGGDPISIGSLGGFFAVLAIAVRNDVTSIHRWQRLDREGGRTARREAVLRGAQDRLRPVLTTAVAAGAVLLPLVALGERPGYEIVRPMATVILGGLVSSTLLSLFVVPVLYLRFGSHPETRRSVAPRGSRTDGGMPDATR